MFEVLEKYKYNSNEYEDRKKYISPEIMGYVFENLLSKIVLENNKSAKKGTGSYYTPYEIVDYMVDETLSQYMKENTI